jgi:hypothetical protein
LAGAQPTAAITVQIIGAADNFQFLASLSLSLHRLLTKFCYQLFFQLTLKITSPRAAMVCTVRDVSAWITRPKYRYQPFYLASGSE